MNGFDRLFINVEKTKLPMDTGGERPIVTLDKFGGCRADTVR